MLKGSTILFVLKYSPTFIIIYSSSLCGEESTSLLWTLLRYSREHYCFSISSLELHRNAVINPLNGALIQFNFVLDKRNENYPLQYYQSDINYDDWAEEKNYDTLPRISLLPTVFAYLGLVAISTLTWWINLNHPKKFLGMIKKPIKDLLPSNLLTPFLSIFGGLSDLATLRKMIWSWW